MGRLSFTDHSLTVQSMEEERKRWEKSMLPAPSWQLTLARLPSHPSPCHGRLVAPVLPLDPWLRPVPELRRWQEGSPRGSVNRPSLTANYEVVCIILLEAQAGWVDGEAGGLAGAPGLVVLQLHHLHRLREHVQAPGAQLPVRRHRDQVVSILETHNLEEDGCRTDHLSTVDRKGVGCRGEARPLNCTPFV